MIAEEKLRYSEVHTAVVTMRYVPACLDECLELLRVANATAINQLVSDLKRQSDLHFGIDPHISFELANMIIVLGHVRDEPRHIALGLMARGDALRMMGFQREAWNTLRLAGKVFRDSKDRVGWGRTRIGLLPLAAAMNKMAFVERVRRYARRIFVECDEHEFAIRLDMNTVYLYQTRGLYEIALELCNELIPLVKSNSDFRDQHLIRIYTNMGFIYTEMGNIGEASKYHHAAWELAKDLGEETMHLRASTNIAYIAWIQGRYREALEGLQAVVDSAGDRFPAERLIARRLIVKCFLSLNRPLDACDLALQITREGPDDDRDIAKGLERGYALIDLATAQAHLTDWEGGYTTLQEADAIFRYSDAQNWRFHSRLRRGQIALRRDELNDIEMARQDASDAAAYFIQNGEQVNLATARLLEAQVAFKVGDLEDAAQASESILQTALSMNIPWLSYSGYLMLAQIAEAQKQINESLIHYESAARTVESMQRTLTITLRPDFLQSREDAFYGMVRLNLQRSDAAHAFEALERNKSQILLSHIANRDHLRWPVHDEQARELVHKLETLRAQYHSFSQLAFGQPASDGNHSKAETQEFSRQKLNQLARRMRDITEQLYMKADGPQTLLVRPPSLAEIQAKIDPDDILIAFFAEAHHLWAVAVERDAINSYRLPMSTRAATEHYEEVRRYVEIALEMARRLGAFSERIDPMTKIAGIKLRALYEGLLGPLAERLQGRRRLLMVPSGILHYLPFHLLANDAGYLIQQHEVVILPAAGLLTLSPVKAAPGALVLADSWGGKLPETARETEQVARLLDGELHRDGEAKLAHLSVPPRSVLHIAAHGEYVVEQPELSYIELNHQQIFTDDLLQRDLSYELVTLSACETGRFRRVPGDELVGLGRGFLYAGAGALITSLWRIDDQLTVFLMEHLYSQLKQGATKAAALRDAQLKLLREMPQLHPAFWGAFQLVGNADPLSSTTL